MHLSPLSEGYQRDARDSDVTHGLARHLQSRAHGEGLLRGLAVLAVFGVLMGLGFMSSDDRPHEASTAPFAAIDR